MAKILIVDDEPRIRELIREHLQYSGYICEEAADGTAALTQLSGGAFDLVILDLMMPFMDGMTCLREMRARHINTPVIILTARSEEYDKLAGLEGGADDYVVKPFSPRELIARIRAVLRRGGAEAEKTVTCGPLTINEARFSAKVQGEPVKLGVIEFKMLLVLASSPGRVYSRAQLLSRVWDDSTELDERTVDVHILRLRKQLAGTAAASLVETVRGLGYRANDAV